MNKVQWFNYVLFVVNAASSFTLSLSGYWTFVFIPSIILAYFLRTNKALWAFMYMAVSGLIGILITIVINPYFFYNGEIAAAIIGLPQFTGSIILLLITLIIALIISGVGGLIGHYIRILSKR